MVGGKPGGVGQQCSEFGQYKSFQIVPRPPLGHQPSPDLVERFVAEFIRAARDASLVQPEQPSHLSLAHPVAPAKTQ